jgi:hypothetical protein
MKPSKILGRVESIKVNIKLDNGECINIDMDMNKLLTSPGIDSIQTVSTILGSVIGNPIKDWVKENPHLTKLQEDIKSDKISFMYHNHINLDAKGYYIEAYIKGNFKTIKYYYKNRYDANDDFEYCKILMKQNEIK